MGNGQRSGKMTNYSPPGKAEGTYVNVMDYTENGKHSCPALPITGQSPRNRASLFESHVFKRGIIAA